MEISALERLIFEKLDVPEDTCLSAWPPATEWMNDPFWYDQVGRDPIVRSYILRMDAGPKRKEKLQNILENYPRYGPKLYERFAEKGRVDLLRELLDLGASMDVEETKEEGGSTEDESMEDRDRPPSVNIEIPLLQAAISGHLDCVKFFVDEANNDIEIKGGLGDTALTHAAARGYLEIVRWLLDSGARINFGQTDARRRDDLCLALQSGNLDVATALLESEQGATESFEPRIDWISAAAASENRDVLTLALALNGFPDVAPDDTNMKTTAPPLTPAQENGVLEALPGAVAHATLDSTRLLLSYLCARDENGCFDALHVPYPHVGHLFHATEDAMEKDDNEVLFELIWDTVLSGSAGDLAAADATVGDRRAQLNRRLISACTEGCPRTVQLLCEKYGADVNHVSHKFFITPLGRVAGSGTKPLPGRFAAGQYLLQRPEIDLHLGTAKYCNGPTALVLAVQEADGGGPSKAEATLPMVRLLLEHGGPLEDINPDLVQHLQSLAPDAAVEIYVVVDNREARLPVRLMLADEYERHHPDTITAILEFTAAEALTVVANAQIRKRDAALAAGDVKRRPLKSNADERQGVQAHRQEQADEADETTLHDVSMHAAA